LNDQYRERDDIPLVPKPAAEGARSGGPARDLDAMFDHRSGTRPMEPPIRSGRPPSFKNNQVARKRPSIGRRMFRALTRVTIAVLIGFGAARAWQSHGDEVKVTVSILAPSLSSLLPGSTAKSPAAAATSRELVQQLEPIVRDLAVVRRGVEQLADKQEQLAAKQEQMDQNIATLRAIEQDIRQKVMSSPPPSRAVPTQPPKPPQPAAPSSSAPPPPPAAGPPVR
jgi:hypothetical protein